jgi:hypothetical protein
MPGVAGRPGAGWLSFAGRPVADGAGCDPPALLTAAPIELLISPRGIYTRQLDSEQHAAAAALRAQHLVELREGRIVPSAIANYGAFRTH